MKNKSPSPLPPENAGREEIIRWYHRRTKHHFHAFAPGPGRMEWSSQPEEFRSYGGTEEIGLEIPETRHSIPWKSLFDTDINTSPLDFRTISSFLYHSMAISAWKRRSGACWALRVPPSSGNLHPLEAYLALPAVEGLGDRPAICHYSPPGHSLERLTRFDEATWRDLTTGLPAGTFFVGITAIHWRCSWKYGERAWRYCRLDAGHTLGALRYAAAALGWGLRLLDVPHQRLAAFLGLPRQDGLPAHERETPELLAAVFPNGGSGRMTEAPLPAAAVDRVAGGPWEGTLTTREGRHRDWPVIERVEEAARPMEGDPGPGPATEKLAAAKRDGGGGDGPDALELVRRRRSATGLDRRGTMEADAFFGLLERLLPLHDPGPWDAMGRAPHIDLHLMIHRVSGLQPGLYTLVRTAGGRERLAAAMNPDYAWDRPAGCPEQLPLFLNLAGDLTDLAEGLSCGQEMAGDAVFTLAMTADLEAALAAGGAPAYRRLFQEAGLVGQALYLEAEAAGLRGCGIGCYFDDGVHKLLGVDEERGSQSLYHFVVGRDVPERGAELLPPYPAPEAR